MPKPGTGSNDELIEELFKNWLATEIREAIQQFGPDIVSELKSLQTPRPFVERFLLCLIRANAAADTPEQQIREKLRTAMLAIFGYGPKHRSDKFDDSAALQWMFDQREYDLYYLDPKSKRRSIEKLAEEAARFAEGDVPSAVADRLRKAYSAQELELEKNASPRRAKTEMIQHAALHDLGERLGLFGIKFHRDD